MRSVARSTSTRSVGVDGQWSNAMATSGPSARWMSTTRSGVRRTRLPSMIDLNETPSASIVARSLMLNTW